MLKYICDYNIGGIMDDKTRVFDLNEINNQYDVVLKDVYLALKEKGYNPINQIIGFLINNDLEYICNHKKARSKISKLNRSKLIEFILKYYFKDNI